MKKALYRTLTVTEEGDAITSIGHVLHRQQRTSTSSVVVSFFDATTGTSCKMSLNRLVLAAFGIDPPNTPHSSIRHLDGDPNNCALSNLVWTTDHHRTIMTAPRVAQAKELRTQGRTIEEIADILEVSESSVKKFFYPRVVKTQPKPKHFWNSASTARGVH